MQGAVSRQRVTRRLANRANSVSVEAAMTATTTSPRVDPSKRSSSKSSHIGRQSRTANSAATENLESSTQVAKDRNRRAGGENSISRRDLVIGSTSRMPAGQSITTRTDVYRLCRYSFANFTENRFGSTFRRATDRDTYTLGKFDPDAADLLCSDSTS